MPTLCPPITYGRWALSEVGWQLVANGELNGELQAGEPIIVTFHVNKLHGGDHELEDMDLTYDVNLTNADNFRLYPVSDNENKVIEAAFMQTDKQKLVKADGTEVELTTMWFYYEDGTFEQYALSDDNEGVLFSTGEYSFEEGGINEEGSVMTLHRTQKYQDGKGLAPYDSTHEYTIGELGFLRIYPEW